MSMPRNILLTGAVARLQALLLLSLLVALSACAEFQQMDTGAEPSVREKIDSCLASCEHDHSICMESTKSQSNAFAAAQECDRGLTACFNLCRNIGDQPKRF